MKFKHKGNNVGKIRGKSQSLSQEPPDTDNVKVKRLLVSKPILKIILVALAILMLVAGAVYFSIWSNYNEPNNIIVLPCSDESEGSILMRAAKELNAADEFNLDNLAGIVTEVESKEGHKDDVNCVYITLEYYSRGIDSEKASNLISAYGEFINEDKHPHESLRSKTVKEVNSRKEFMDSYLENNLRQGQNLAPYPEH